MARDLLSFVFVCCAGWPMAATAQSDRAEREVDVLGEPGERPVSAYGATDVPLTLVFDAPLKLQDGGVVLAVPGVDSRVHPFKNNALIVTVSADAGTGGPIHLRVPLETWVAEITLDLTNEKIDHVLKILRQRRSPDGGVELTPRELRRFLRIAASATLRGKECATFDDPEMPQPEMVEQPAGGRRPLVCVVEDFTVVRVERTALTCPVAWARVLHGDGAVEVLFMGAAVGRKGAFQTLVLRTPLEAANDYELELFAADGTVCERYKDLTLQPGGTL